MPPSSDYTPRAKGVRWRVLSCAGDADLSRVRLHTHPAFRVKRWATSESAPARLVAASTTTATESADRVEAGTPVASARRRFELVGEDREHAAEEHEQNAPDG